MKVFFQIKFSITAKEETQIEEELSNYVLTWLESKYGVAAKRAISACKSLLSDSEFGDPNGLFVETVHYEDVKYAQHNLWACKVMEPPKRWGKFAPRRWATEVGYEQTSDKSADISYSVRYDDIASNGEKRAPRPQSNLPKLAEMLISSEKWICTANGEVLHATNYQQHVGPIFGIDKCRAAKEQALNAGEDKMDKHWISLCKVNRPDKNRDIWMLRLADAVGGVLVAPYFDKQKEQIHDNRLFVFCDDGPTEPGRIGFWEWEEFESEPGRWKTTSTYMEQASPVEVIVLDEVSNIEGVIMSLKSGLKIPSYAHGKIIFAAKNDTGFEGVLCDTGESLLRQRNPELVALRDDIYTLPYYKLSKSDIFEWKYEWESRKIYKYISLREPQKRIPIYPISETIKNIFLSSMGWPIFKAQAILKNDYLKFREALASIPKESILERVADTYGISIQEAQTYVDEFLQMVEKYMTVEDVDSAVITRILSKHGGLWQKCNDIAYNKWIADHANEVNTAQEELAVLQHKVAQAENDASSAKEKHGDILREVAEAQDDLCRLQAEIARYKILEKETVAAIREKIAGAQKNVAGFIADLSILLPQATSNESGWKYRHISAVYPEDEVGVSKDWKDELNELSQNLSYSLNVEPDLATMLAAFLYSAHIHNAPMVALQAYLQLKGNSLDVIPAIDFLDENLQDFCGFLDTFAIDCMSILVPINSQKALRSYKSSLKDSLSVLKLKRDAHPELFESDGSGDSSKKTFLDALYEEGIIPTYSFPKNVVSTYISGIDGKVKYQVERGLDVAIGEYAPGRAIVVDKTTYQIGGLYYPGGGRTEQTAYSPARAFIQDASYCKNISTCTECGWFGLDEDHPHKCPFCGNDKLTHMLPMLRPWGFAPRDAKAIEQAQLSEEYTATQQPLYSTLPDADDVVAIKGYSNTRMAVRPNQRIIMLNKGIGDKGFTICCDCGAAMPGDDPSVLKDIMRPYRSKFLRTRCKHNETKNVNLGYDFITDMLVLEIALDRQQVSMDLAKNSWLNRAGQSLAEALRLSACQELDIEFTELVTGFRVRQNQKGDFIDIYLYDSLSSGAGYAVSIEASIQQLLIKTRELLSSCNCDSACHKCLKHYRNQYVHGLLDRSAALDLLTWAEKGVRSPMLPVYEQRNLLQSVEQILQFSGVHIDFDHEPIEAESFHGKKRIVVYPAMWARPTEKNMVFVSDSYLKYAKPYALKTIVDGL